MAAGLGFKTFTTGEVLTAADTNGYLMQGVLVFASSAARAAAITSPQEGQYSYLKDTNSTEYYDGAAWIAAPIGDITGVTAGTGISGGGTSGTVTVTNDMATTITTKGDLVPGTGSGTYARLAVGTNGQTLVADSSTATGLKWATASGGGKVLQVVSATTTTQVTIATTTLTDTGITASITPTLSTSKILVMIMYAQYSSRLNTYCWTEGQMMRDSTVICDWTTGDRYFTGFEVTSGSTYLAQKATLSYLDSPATTSSTTYKLQAKMNASTNSGTTYFQSQGEISSIILMEIGA